MAKGKVRDLEKGFSVEEEKIVKDFLAGKSIRAISKDSSLGRTAIKNIIISYQKLHPELSDEIDKILFGNKTHSGKQQNEIKEISEEKIIEIYNQIMSGEKTLTKASLETGRNREYIKRRILNYLNDYENNEEFLNKLKENKSKSKDIELLEFFMKLPEIKRKEVIFDKVNLKREKLDKMPYNDNLLNRKFNRLKKYFLIDRNNKFESQLLTEDEFWKMIYYTPGLITYSLSDKIDPAMRNLDKNIDPINATKIVTEDASILASSIPRTNLQIKILVDNGILDVFLKKPRCFRTSPELIYSLIKFAEDNNKSKEAMLLTTVKTDKKEELKDKYNIQEEYGEYEYFDK